MSTHHHAIHRWPFLAFLFCAAACGGTTVSQSDAPDAGADTGTSVSALDGTWTGYVDGQNFPSAGSNKVVMKLFTSGASITGTIVFGGDPPARPAPPTDPNVGYPPGYGDDHSTNKFVGGFPYTIQSGTFDGSHLEVGVNLHEVWAAWCALQTPYASKDGTLYSCVPPDWTYDTTMDGGCELWNPMTMVPATVDCAKLRLCRYDAWGAFACSCTASDCTTFTISDVHFDLIVTGTKADGKKTGELGDYDAHFTRDP